MTDYAIHSPNDPEPLIRLHDELVKHGFITTKWNENQNPNKLNKYAKMYFRKVFFYTLCIDQQKVMEYHSFNGEIFEDPEVPIPVHRDLTPENFNSVLNEVLQNFGINV